FHSNNRRFSNADFRINEPNGRPEGPNHGFRNTDLPLSRGTAEIAARTGCRESNHPERNIGGGKLSRRLSSPIEAGSYCKAWNRGGGSRRQRVLARADY